MRYHRIPLLLRTTVHATGGFLLAAGLSAAETAPPEGEVIELAPYEARAAEDTGPALRRETSAGLFGPAEELLEVPRALTVVGSGLLDERGVEDVRGLSRLVPGAYAPSRFGHVTLPNIRGDLGETYLNGQRRAANIFGYQPSFNAVETAEVVRGPGSVVQGPGFYSGGFVNFVTKQPRFEETSTEVTAWLGSWSPDEESWWKARWQVDHNQPLGEKSALRVSYEGQENETLFEADGGRDDHQDLFLAFAHEVSERLRFDLNAQLLWQAKPQLMGYNRPNNTLTHDGLYFTGTAPVDGSAVNRYAPLAPTGTVPIDHTLTLLSPGDSSRAVVGHVQGIVTFDLAEDLRLVNRTFGERVDRERYHAFEYIELVEQHTFENRTELHWTFGSGERRHQVTTGAVVRFEQKEAQANYFDELLFPYDLTAGRTQSVVDYLTAGGRPDLYFTPFGVPGGEGYRFYGADAGVPENSDSDLWNLALFWRHEVPLGQRWTFTYGLRADHYEASATDSAPATTPPLADTYETTNLSAEAALRFRPDDRQSYYLAATHTTAVNGATTGGSLLLFDGFSYGPLKGLDPEDFENESVLLELGGRWELLAGAAYIGATAFRQERSRVEFGGQKSDIRVQGVELEGGWEIRDGVHLNANLAWQDGRYEDSAPYEFGGLSLFDEYAAGTGPGGQGTGVGFSWASVPPGDYRIPGLSRWSGSAGVHQKLDSGFGWSLWADAHSEQPGNLLGEYTIPAQVWLNASVSYTHENWEVAFFVYNLSDEDNWIHNGDPFFENQVVFLDLPRRFEARLRF